jgi:hypothetical protein
MHANDGGVATITRVVPMRMPIEMQRWSSQNQPRTCLKMLIMFKTL